MAQQSSHRAFEQEILAIKKGAHLLKCGRIGKPQFCPFRLSTDEKHLIWYSGQKEKQLRLSSVNDIITGQRTVNFLRLLQQDKASHSFSLIYANGERSLDLICKDKAQADSWFVGLKTVISRYHQSNSTPSHRGALSCTSSPSGYARRKYNLRLLEDATGHSQSESGNQGLSCSSERMHTFGSGMQRLVNMLAPNSPRLKPRSLTRVSSLGSSVFAQGFGSAQVQKNGVLMDVMIWGEAGGFDDGSSHATIPTDTFSPKVLESAVMLDVHSVALGEKHAGLVTKHGEVFCWGDANGGKLGHKVNLNSSKPKIVDSLKGVNVKSISCGAYQTCVLTSSGELYTWGNDNAGVERSRNQWWPHKIALHGITISSVACGSWHTAIVSQSGELFTYGDGTFGALGHGSLASVSQPKKVASLERSAVKSVSCGSWHTAAIVEITNRNNATGNLFTWGDADKGKLGHDDDKLLPTLVARLVDQDFVRVSCGRMLTVGLTSTGVVYTMGSALHGQLGNPHAKGSSVTLVEGALKDEFVKEISSGSCHVAVLTVTGSVYTWGKGANGQLGLGDSNDRNSPTFVESLKDRQVSSIACGSNVTAAICLHKPVSSRDQSACKGCAAPFGIARKKHNCYNCGFLFCKSCSTNKASNAALETNKNKVSRVCDPCFNRLQRFTPSYRGEECSTTRWSARKLKNRDQREERWGQVHCSSLFENYSGRDSMALVPFFDDKLSNGDRACTGIIPQLSDHSVSGAMTVESDQTLAAEIQRLKAEVRILEKQCEMGSKRLQECRETIEEAWTVAKDEAAKCKAAKDIIKALAIQVKLRGSAMPVEEASDHGEWVEQCEQGVYITLSDLKNGHKGLKRVRFSRKRYSDEEAKRWWEENQAMVYQKYDIEGYTN